MRNIHGYISHSREDYLVFSKIFWYSWFIIVIFPTFGLTTFQSILVRLATTSRISSSVKWQCFFQPATSAFFVELVTTAALITTAVELIRPVDLLYSIFSLICAKTEANLWAATKNKTKFGFGENYGKK